MNNLDLHVSDLLLEYPLPDGQRLKVLDISDFIVKQGNTIGIMGPSGCGKTSLLYALSGIENPQLGVIQWGEINIAALPAAGRDRWRYRNIGFIFQDFHLIPKMTTLKNVLLPVGKKIAPVHGHYIEDLPISEKDMDEYESHEYTVVGRMPALGTPWDRAIIVPIESVWEIHGLYESHSKKIGPPWKERLPGVPAVVVKPETFSDAYRIKSKYNTESTIAIFPADVLLRFYDLLGNIRDVMAGISIASQILVLTAILLTIFIMLNNRKRQIAVLRAIGASPAYIFSAIWLYTVLLIVIGVVLGIIFGWLSSHFLTAAFSARTGLQMTAVITVRELIMAGSLVFLGMSIAIIPAWMSYRRSVAEGLKSQE